jgi:hypothetical protein
MANLLEGLRQIKDYELINRINEIINQISQEYNILIEQIYQNTRNILKIANPSKNNTHGVLIRVALLNKNNITYLIYNVA